MKNPRDAERGRNSAAGVSLHIERIVLEGYSFTRAELGRLQSSLERELTSLLRTRGVSGSSRAEASRTAPVRGLPPGRSTGAASQTPAQLGREIARGIYQCLDPGV